MIALVSYQDVFVTYWLLKNVLLHMLLLHILLHVFQSQFTVSVCDLRAFLKQSAEIVYLLDGKNASVILQGKTHCLSLSVFSSHFN